MSNRQNQQKAQKQTSDEPVQAERIVPFKSGSLLHIAHNTHVVNIPRKMSKAELENPDYWTFQSNVMARFDRVQAQAVDGSQIAFGIVTYCRAGDVRVKFYESYDLETVDMPEVNMDGFTIKYGGFEEDWIIVNDKTGDTLARNKPTQEAAIQYLTDHFKSVG